MEEIRDIVIEKISEATGISPSEILGKRRFRDTALARHISMWALAKLYNYSTPQIGQCMDRDHTTVVYAVNKIEKMPELFKAKYKRVLREDIYHEEDQSIA